MPKDFLGLAPMSVLCQRISSVLNPGVENLDCPLGGAAGGAGGVDVWAPGTAVKIRFLFREFVSELLQVHTYASTFLTIEGFYYLLIVGTILKKTNRRGWKDVGVYASRRWWEIFSVVAQYFSLSAARTLRFGVGASFARKGWGPSALRPPSLEVFFVRMRASMESKARGPHRIKH